MVEQPEYWRQLLQGLKRRAPHWHQKSHLCVVPYPTRMLKPAKDCKLLVSLCQSIIDALHPLYKVHADRSGKCSIGKCVSDVAPVIRQSSFDVVIHATTWSQHTIASPSGCTFPGVRVLFSIHGRSCGLANPGTSPDVANMSTITLLITSIPRSSMCW